MSEGLTYKAALDLMGAAGDAMVKLTDGFKHMVTTGYSGYNHISAKRTHKRLVSLSARATQIQYHQQSTFVYSIDDYLSIDIPTPLHWTRVVRGIKEVLKKLTKILDDVHKERSDFVLENAYAKLTESLAARLGLLAKLSKMPPPKSEDEKESLRKIQEEYKRLLNNFREAIEQLNLYLKYAK
jgi:hypothetical protein